MFRFKLRQYFGGFRKRHVNYLARSFVFERALTDLSLWEGLQTVLSRSNGRGGARPDEATNSGEEC